MTAVIRKSLQVEGFEKASEVSVVLTDDEQIRVFNREYRKVDRPTDVLAFSQLEGEPIAESKEPIPLGDIIVSVETAQRQADERDISLEEEMDLLVAHGVLHLLGYGDETEEEAEQMRSRERVILSGHGRTD